MPDTHVTHTRPENEAEQRLRTWYQDQALTSPDTLDAAARTLEGLATGMLGILFGILTVADDPLPAYMALGLVRGLGILTVTALLAALVCALAVIFPRKLSISLARPDEQRATFTRLLQEKSRWLSAALIAFGIGLSALAGILVIALL